MLNDYAPQEPILYVSDPKALHSMLIQDENIFQETSEFTRYVGQAYGSPPTGLIQITSVNRALFGTCLMSTIGEACVAFRPYISFNAS